MDKLGRVEESYRSEWNYEIIKKEVQMDFAVFFLFRVKLKK